MKRFLTLMLLCAAVMTAVAQSKADILVSYESNSRNWESDSMKTGRMSLLANARESKYFNDLSLWSDSLSSTPEGKKQLQQIIMAACMTRTEDGGMSFDMRKGPVKKVHTYVFTKPADNTLRYYSRLANNPCFYDETLDEQQWQIGDSTQTILGYECIKAETDYHGRRWTAWFAPEIPMPYGPWKLHGLPGLILKAVADNGDGYIATGIEKTERIISPMYSADDYSKVDRKKALADHEYFVNNRESIMQAEHGGSVTFKYDINARPKYDAAKYAPEPDYK